MTAAMLEVENPLSRFRLPALLVLIAAIYGTTGYMLIEGWGVLDAFYMTITTMATVGFGEIHPLSDEGRFAIYRRQRHMTSEIERLRDHFIICGFGRIGTQIASEFDRQRVRHLVIETNPAPLARLRREGRLFIEGDAASEDMLRAAGIEHAKGLLAVVDSDERVVYITLAARALNPALFITARAGQPESIRRLELAGASRIVSPYRMAGRLMAELALRPAVVDVIETMRHGGGSIGIEEILVGEACRSRGRSLHDAGLLGSGHARLLALRRRDGGMHVNPSPDLRLEDGDLVVAMGSEEELTATAALLQ